MLRFTKIYPLIEAMNTRWFANNVSFKLIGGSFKDEALKVNYHHTTFKHEIKTVILPLQANTKCIILL